MTDRVHFRSAVVALLLLAFIVSSCKPPSPTPAPIAPAPTAVEKIAPTSTAAVQPADTQAPPTKAPTPEVAQPNPAQIQLQWSLKIGKLRFFGVAKDGTITGIGDGLYAVISPDGKVVQTSEIDLKNSLRMDFFGGSNSFPTSDWFRLLDNGSLVTFADVGGHGPTVITPGDPPQVSEAQGSYLPFSNEGVVQNKDQIPNDFTYIKSSGHLKGRAGYWLDLRRWPEPKVNEATGEVGFISRNGQFTTLKLPDKVKDITAVQMWYTITPWDDFYYTYQSQDALGNKTGFKTVVVYADGTNANLEKMPVYLDTSNMSNPFVSSDPITYLPAIGRIYYAVNNVITVLDTKFQTVATYPFPADLKVDPNNDRLFIGNDQALYYLHTSMQESTLTKYTLPGN